MDIPKNIVELDHKQMIDFHNHFYHPSNGQAVCYGPQDFVDQCMATLDGVLKHHRHNEKIRRSTAIPWQNSKRILASMDSIPYPSISDTSDFRVANAWMLNDEPMDGRTEVAWFLIEELLIGTPAALISKVVFDLDLGDDIIGGLETTLQQWTLTIGVSGLKSASDSDTVIKTINDKLVAISSSGFNEGDLNAAINKLELRVRSPPLPPPLQMMLLPTVYDESSSQHLTICFWLLLMLFFPFGFLFGFSSSSVGFRFIVP